MAVLLAAMAGATATPAHAQSEPALRDCGWTSKVSGDQANALYPDEAAKYWNAALPIPPGGHIEVKGRFPRARYMSFHSYDQRALAIDALADVELRPDAGSTNPFAVGAARTAAARGYTMRVVNDRAPASGRPPNTLYTENADGTRTSRASGGSFFTIRVYEPDRGLDDTGGVGLPRLTLVTADGSRRSAGECPPALAPDSGATGTLADLGFAGSLPKAQTLGADPPRWYRHKGAASSYSLIYGQAGGEAIPGLGEQLSARAPENGLGENSHNKYIFTVANRTYGEVLLLQARAPSFPSTVNGEPVMGDGQLRYWSFCSNLDTTQYLACRNDDAFPLDRDRRYTVAVSTAASRPANARAECGVTWLPFGPEEKSVLILRNMLPRPDFAEAVQRAEQGQEEAAMRDYYPRGRYLRIKADFEKLGCRPPEFAAARSGCLRRTLRVTRRGIGPVRVGSSRKQLLRSAGPPRNRSRLRWRWCVAGGGHVSAAFERGGRSARLVGTTASRHRARGVGRGSRAQRARQRFPNARRLRRGVLESRARGGRVVFGIRRGRVRYVATAGTRVRASRRPLRMLLDRAGLRPR